MLSKRENCFTMTDEQWNIYLTAFSTVGTYWNFVGHDLNRKYMDKASENYDGHHSCFYFTTGIKVAFGTPDLDFGLGRYQLQLIPNFTHALAAMSFAYELDLSFDYLYEEAEKLREFMDRKMLERASILKKSQFPNPKKKTKRK